MLREIEEQAEQTEAVVRLEVRSEVPERPLHLHYWTLMQTLLMESSGTRCEEGGTEAQGRRGVMRM